MLSDADRRADCRADAARTVAPMPRSLHERTNTLRRGPVVFCMSFDTKHLARRGARGLSQVGGHHRRYLNRISDEPTISSLFVLLPPFFFCRIPTSFSF